MTIGTGIAVASFVLGAILLFSMTKDRWNWGKITVRCFGLGLGAAALVFLWSHVPLWLNTLENRRQIAVTKAAQDREAAVAQAAQDREALARPCIAEDLLRMEEMARTVQRAVSDRMTLKQIRTTVDGLTKIVGQIHPADDDIKERELVYMMPTRCDSSLRFTMAVRADALGSVRWFRVWVQDAPNGYEDGLHPDLSTDFEQIRWERAKRDLAAVVKPKPLQITVLEDPCAPDLSRQERLKRLGAFGNIRQEGGSAFTAGDHKVVFAYDRDGLFFRASDLSSCR